MLFRIVKINESTHVQSESKQIKKATVARHATVGYPSTYVCYRKKYLTVCYSTLIDTKNGFRITFNNLRI